MIWPLPLILGCFVLIVQGPDLLEDSSELIYAGEMNKVNSAGWSQERNFFLFDHQLVYCKKVTNYCFVSNQIPKFFLSTTPQLLLMLLKLQICLWKSFKWNQNSLFASVGWLSKINYIFSQN